MATARIFRPNKNPMQSGTAKDRWKLEFAPEKPYFSDPLMGWRGMTDMPQQLHLHFDTKEEAIAYAQKHGIPYEVFEPKVRKQQKNAYSDNFKFAKVKYC